MDKITRVGIDLGKRVLHVTALDASDCQGRAVMSVFRQDKMSTFRHVNVSGLGG